MSACARVCCTEVHYTEEDDGVDGDDVFVYECECTLCTAGGGKVIRVSRVCAGVFCFPTHLYGFCEVRDWPIGRSPVGWSVTFFGQAGRRLMTISQLVTGCVRACVREIDAVTR